MHQVVEQGEGLLAAFCVTGVGDRHVVGVSALEFCDGANQRLAARV